jgi:hypothetical protein
MFFNLFGKKNSFQKKFVNIIYLSENAKQAAIVKYAEENPMTIFIAWFENTATIYKILFITHQLDENRIVESKEFSVGKYANQELIFLEHYPLIAKEEAFVVNCRQEVFTFYNALTEPLFQYFGGEKLIEVLQRLGTGEKERIEYAMINKSILRAQRKITKQVSFEKMANSQKDWMLVNVNSAMP